MYRAPGLFVALVLLSEKQLGSGRATFVMPQIALKKRNELSNRNDMFCTVFHFYGLLLVAASVVLTAAAVVVVVVAVVVSTFSVGFVVAVVVVVGGVVAASVVFVVVIVVVVVDAAIVFDGCSFKTASLLLVVSEFNRF